MGAIKGVLLVFVSVLFFVSLLVGNLFLTLSLSLDYDNVQSGLVSAVKGSTINDMNVEELIGTAYPIIQLYCEDNSEFVFDDPTSGHTFVIPCDVVNQGSEAILDYALGDIVEDIYYEEVDCEFWDCFEKTGSPLFLISAKAKDYWNSKFYFSLIASVVLIGLMFFLVEKKSNLFIISGSLLIVSSLPFMKLNWVLTFLPANQFLEFLTIFFTKASTVFLIALISGIAFLITGILLKLFKIGFIISNLFSKKGKNVSKDKMKPIVKKRISKVKEKLVVKKGIFKKINNKKSK